MWGRVASFSLRMSRPPFRPSHWSIAKHTRRSCKCPSRYLIYPLDSRNDRGKAPSELAVTPTMGLALSQGGNWIRKRANPPLFSSLPPPPSPSFLRVLSVPVPVNSCCKAWPGDRLFVRAAPPPLFFPPRVGS